MSRHMERLAVHRTAGEGCLTEVVIFSKHIVTMNRAHRAAGLVVSMNRTEGRLTERRTEDRLTEAARIRTQALAQPPRRTTRNATPGEGGSELLISRAQCRDDQRNAGLFSPARFPSRARCFRLGAQRRGEPAGTIHRNLSRAISAAQRKTVTQSLPPT